MIFSKPRQLPALCTTLLLLSLAAGCASHPKQPAAPASGDKTVEKTADKAPEKAAEAPRPVEPVKTQAQRKAEAELARGLAAYDDADYKTAGQALQQALDQGLASRADQAKAYKHLAFIACAGNQVDVCKAHFRKALAANPRLILSKSEAGHPVWGPAFKEVKAERMHKTNKAEAGKASN